MNTRKALANLLAEKRLIKQEIAQLTKRDAEINAALALIDELSASVSSLHNTRSNIAHASKSTKQTMGSTKEVLEKCRKYLETRQEAVSLKELLEMLGQEPTLQARNNLSAKLFYDIKRNPDTTLFEKVGRGMFRLKKTKQNDKWFEFLEKDR